MKTFAVLIFFCFLLTVSTASWGQEVPLPPEEAVLNQENQQDAGSLTVEGQEEKKSAEKENFADFSGSGGSGGGTTVVNHYFTTYVENPVTSKEVYDILDKLNLSREDPSAWAVASWELAKKKGFVVGILGPDGKIYDQPKTPADRQEVTAIALRVYEQMLNDLKGNHDKLTTEFDKKLSKLDTKVGEELKKLQIELEAKIAEEARLRAEADTELKKLCKLSKEEEQRRAVLAFFLILFFLGGGVILGVVNKK